MGLTENKLNESLASFLKENGALDKFLINLSKTPNYLEILSNTRLVNIFFSAFVWEESPEGGPYWVELSNKFIKQIIDED